MAYQYQRKSRRPMGEINVVPYIDVMLVLLVIFMITAPLLSQGVKVDLPQAKAQPVDQGKQEPFVVTVDARGRYYANLGGDPSQALDADTLATRVAAVLRLREGTPVYVRGDAGVPYGKVVTAMALLQGAGAGSVGLLTEPPEAR